MSTPPFCHADLHKRKRSFYPQVHADMRKTIGVGKSTLRQIVAKNIAEAMARTPGLETQPALAARAGVAQSQISRILHCEIGVGLDSLETIAEALGRHPGELLMDTEEIRRLVVERFLATPPVSDAKVERHLPAAPSKVIAMRHRKRRGE